MKRMVQVRDGESRDSHDGAGDKGEGEPHPEFPIPLASKTTEYCLRKEDGFAFSRVDDWACA